MQGRTSKMALGIVIPAKLQCPSRLNRQQDGPVAGRCIAGGRLYLTAGKVNFSWTASDTGLLDGHLEVSAVGTKDFLEDRHD